MSGILTNLEKWLERIDPGAHRRIKGLRLVTAYGIALALGTLRDVSAHIPSNLSLGVLAGNFALWASVSGIGIGGCIVSFSLARRPREAQRSFVAFCVPFAYLPMRIGKLRRDLENA